MQRKYIGELLVETGHISQDQLLYALNLKKKKYHHKKIGKVLLDLDYISDDILIKLLARQCGIQGVNIHNRTIHKSIIDLITRKTAEKYQVIPLGFNISGNFNKLVIATSNPSDLNMIDNICSVTDQAIDLVYAREEDIDWAIKHYYKEDGVVVQ